jgi:hypothetical protein
MLCTQALDRFRALGSPANAGITLNHLGAIARERGEYGRAAERLRESLTIFVTNGIRHLVADNFEELAGVATATGRAELAARLLGAAEALREELGLPLSPADSPAVEATAAAARAALGDEAFEAARAEGRALPLEQAIAEALASDMRPE